MAEGLVGLGHLVGVLAPLDGGAKAVHGIDELGGELLAHALAAALARRLDEPADAERQPPLAADLDRHLVRRAADAAGFDLDDRSGIPERGLHDLEARPLRLELGPRERLAQDALGEAALAVGHELRVEARRRPVDRDVLVLGLSGDPGSTGHQRPPAAGAAFAPYLLRPCFRSRTPAASRVPRMMWYLTDGRSLTLPPRTSTTECSWRL